jgi:hypothetical protein
VSPARSATSDTEIRIESSLSSLISRITDNINARLDEMKRELVLVKSNYLTCEVADQKYPARSEAEYVK